MLPKKGPKASKANAIQKTALLLRAGLNLEFRKLVLGAGKQDRM
jgi:hypothetical protein